jgi:cytochrome c oxidase subunit 2
MRSPREEFQHLFWRLYAPVAAGAVLVVVIAVVVIVVRYRGAARTSGAASNVALELGAAFVLAAIAAVLLTGTFSAEGSVDRLHRADLVIDATAFQWGWTFSYSHGHVSTTSSPTRPATLVVPVGETVEIDLRSRDVIHEMWVPEQRFKRQAFPGRVTRFDLRFDRAGRFPGLCSAFCGLHHEDMTFTVDARSPASFRAWLSRGETR